MQVHVSPSLVAQHRRSRGAPGLVMVRLVVLHAAELLRDIFDAMSSRGLHTVHMRTPGAYVQRLTLIFLGRVVELSHACCGFHLYYLPDGCCSAVRSFRSRDVAHETPSVARCTACPGRS